MKCQGWNHMAQDCQEEKSKCSNCAGEHKTTDCSHPHTKRCISCVTDDHASWSRECPTFLKRVEDFNMRNPENLLPFFPTNDPWTWSIRVANCTQAPVRNSTSKSQLITNSVNNKTEAKGHQDRGEPTSQATTPTCYLPYQTTGGERT